MQAEGEGKPAPFYTSYAEIEGSGAWVNVLTGAAVLAGAGALGLVALDRKAGKAMGKLLSGGEESLTQPGAAAAGGHGRAVPKAAMLGAWCASAAGGLLSCGAQIVRIYNSKQCLVRTRHDGTRTCTAGPPGGVAQKLIEVFFHPHDFLGSEVNSGEGPTAAAYVGVVLLVASLALAAVSCRALEHQRDGVSRQLQRIPRPPAQLPAGARKALFTALSPVAGATQTASHLLQNALLLLLVIRWLLPEPTCTTADGVEECVRHWPFELAPDEDFPSMFLTKWGKQMGQVAGDTSECSNGRLVL